MASDCHIGLGLDYVVVVVACMWFWCVGVFFGHWCVGGGSFFVPK